MKLSDLTQEEQVALAALMEVTMIPDGRLSENEELQLEGVVAELGEEHLHALLDEAEERFPARKGLQDFLRMLGRQEARELIYGTVLSEALEDTVMHSEAEFLDWLAREWKIPMQVETPESTQ